MSQPSSQPGLFAPDAPLTLSTPALARVQVDFSLAARSIASDELVRTMASAASAGQNDTTQTAGQSPVADPSALLLANLTDAFMDQTFARQLFASDPALFSSDSRGAPTDAVLVGIVTAVRLIDSIDQDQGTLEGESGAGGNPTQMGERVSFSTRELVVGVVVFVSATALCVGFVFAGLWYLNARQSAAVQAEVDEARRMQEELSRADAADEEEGEGDREAARMSGTRLAVGSSVWPGGGKDGNGLRSAVRVSPHVLPVSVRGSRIPGTGAPQAAARMDGGSSRTFAPWEDRGHVSRSTRHSSLTQTQDEADAAAQHATLAHSFDAQRGASHQAGPNRAGTEITEAWGQGEPGIDGAISRAVGSDVRASQRQSDRRQLREAAIQAPLSAAERRALAGYQGGPHTTLLQRGMHTIGADRALDPASRLAPPTAADPSSPTTAHAAALATRRSFNHSPRARRRSS